MCAYSSSYRQERPGTASVPPHEDPALPARCLRRPSVRGKPRGGLSLEGWLPDETLLAIAAENNLSETAFLVAWGSDYELRWFTPRVEVDLCGHATLAAGEVVLRWLQPGSAAVRFHTRRAGVLGVERRNGLLVLDFPARTPRPSDPPPGLIDALGGTPRAVFTSERDHLVVYDSEAEIARLAPAMAPLAAPRRRRDRDGAR
jgi:predicted PhzF superfamily epimerase YddE/YHI9